MNTSIIVGSIALALAGVLATGHAFGEATRPVSRQTANEKAMEREALRRAALADCTKPDLSPAQFEACRAASPKL